MVWWVQRPRRQEKLQDRTRGGDSSYRQNLDHLLEFCCKGKHRNGMVTGRAKFEFEHFSCHHSIELVRQHKNRNLLSIRVCHQQLTVGPQLVCLP